MKHRPCDSRASIARGLLIAACGERRSSKSRALTWSVTGSSFGRGHCVVWSEAPEARDALRSRGGGKEKGVGEGCAVFLRCRGIRLSVLKSVSKEKDHRKVAKSDEAISGKVTGGHGDAMRTSPPPVPLEHLHVQQHETPKLLFSGAVNTPAASHRAPDMAEAVLARVTTAFRMDGSWTSASRASHM